MRRLPQNLSLMAVSVFTVTAVAVAPVAARQGSDDANRSGGTLAAEDTSGSSSSTASTSGSNKNSSSDSGTSRQSETENEIENENPNGDDNVKTQVADLRSAAQQLLVTKRQNGKTKTVEDRQKACSAHQKNLEVQQKNFVFQAKKHLTTYNNMYDKVLKFQADKQLTAANFESLKSAADTKKTTAAAAVTALSEAATTIDCDSADPAANVATLKTAVSNARTALQDYRKAVKDVVVALQSAKSNRNTTEAQ